MRFGDSEMQERTKIKMRIERELKSLMKERKILFSHLEEETPLTSDWRTIKGFINHNTRKIGVLRKNWREYAIS